MERWNPWRALRERPEVTLCWTFLEGGRGLCEFFADGQAHIHLDPRLSRRERRCVLAHELVHAERGLGYDSSTPQLLVDREERTVWREAARRLVPVRELAELVERCDTLDLWEICDHFDVDAKTARIASGLLRERTPT